MKKQAFKIRASGEVALFAKVNGSKELKWTRSNEILPSAYNILAYLIALDTDGKIDKIRIFSGSNMVYEAPITVTTVIDNETTISFEAEASDDSFSGAFERLQLYCSGLDKVFSELVGLEETKPVNSPIYFTWNIKIEQ